MDYIIPHNYQIERADREKASGHRTFVLWFTGLSGSGKSTIANQVAQLLFQKGIRVYTLDGDNIRAGINKGLSFTPEDRKENLRRIAEVSKLFVDAGSVVIAAFVSPMISDRKMIEDIVGTSDFLEVYINTSLEECERRDVKGLYKKARAGEIPNFTGISAPYEPPVAPFITIETEKETVMSAAERVVAAIQTKLEIQS
ncbi:adenylylsulfate kinase [Pustulibacterium marinum]|uniref:Adenylyl-sulfate kinase n=1 Tax=Pustulibacterium marinum TaxID=1224947 RepID=A0A1I7F1I1_9FLAO|nr:adenylyl-sulfate kinase [Pustulibacterium marinum]SFU30020.1 adenylylsulfate kinase [Pustulibacterium marinum]